MSYKKADVFALAKAVVYLSTNSKIESEAYNPKQSRMKNLSGVTFEAVAKGSGFDKEADVAALIACSIFPELNKIGPLYDKLMADKISKAKAKEEEAKPSKFTR